MTNARRKSAHSPILIQLAVVVFLPVIVYFAVTTVKRPTQFDHPPTEHLVCVTEARDYSVAQEGFSVEITSGERGFELNHPVIEVWRSGAWYSVRADHMELGNKGHYGGDRTMELLYIGEHETKEFSVSLWPYEGSLKPGRYRAIFASTGTDDYVSYEFDLI